MAIGAQPGGVLCLIVRQGMAVALAGIGVGVAVAVVVTSAKRAAVWDSAARPGHISDRSYGVGAGSNDCVRYAGTAGCTSGPRHRAARGVGLN